MDIKEKSEFKHGFTNAEAVARRSSVKKVFLKIWQSSQENTCTRVFFNKVEKTLAQVFFCEFCKISKNTVFYRTPPVAACHNRDYLHCALLKVLHAFQEKRPWVKGCAIFSSKCSNRDFQNNWKQHEIHQSSLLN